MFSVVWLLRRLERKSGVKKSVRNLCGDGILVNILPSINSKTEPTRRATRCANPSHVISQSFAFGVCARCN